MINRRGAVTIALALLIALAGVLGIFLGSSRYAKNIGLSSDQKITNTTVTQPVVLKGPNGEQYLATKTTTYEGNQPTTLGFWAKVWNLGLIYVILCIAGIFCAPLGIAMHLFNNKAKAALQSGISNLQAMHADLRLETKRIVDSVEAALMTIKDPVVKQAFMDELSKAQDASTKVLVSQLKQQ